MRKVLMLLIVGALGVGLVAAGCGGDDDDGTTAATTGATGATGAAGDEPLSRAVFIGSADEICRQGDREIDRQGQDQFQDQEPSEQELERFGADVIAPTIQEQIDQISELPAPEGDEDQVTAIVDAAQSGIDQIEEDPSILSQGGDAGGAFAEANRLASDYGLRVCGQG